MTSDSKRLPPTYPYSDDLWDASHAPRGGLGPYGTGHEIVVTSNPASRVQAFINGIPLTDEAQTRLIMDGEVLVDHHGVVVERAFQYGPIPYEFPLIGWVMKNASGVRPWTIPVPDDPEPKPMKKPRPFKGSKAARRNGRPRAGSKATHPKRRLK